jgi:sec-independent protein translocase protein TatA
MNALQPWHLIILVLVVVLLFGAKRLPDAARSIGKSMKIFKAETKDMRSSGSTDTPSTGEQTASATEPDTRQLPQSTPPASPTSGTTPAADPAAATAAQVEQLQRQLDELKRQQAEQAQRNAG